MTEHNSPTTLTQSIRRSAIGLAIFACFTAGLISVTHYFTQDTILANQRAYEARQLLSLLPDGYAAETLLNSARTLDQINATDLSLLHVAGDEHYFRAINDQGQVDAILLPLVAPEGYSEAIRLIVGISPSGAILGARVTRHRETPGLGDQVELQKSNWILQFNGRSLANPLPTDWQVKKDGGQFDQLTGATITPRAIVTALSHGLEFFAVNRTRLLADAVTETEQ
ncbi:electron transport complex subunit RsxG [Reinekea sp.]|jgi:electron transport complex protein RnfG|uniref:electron transport complex subunit RsxG n=1 Tax=Reinekea sp. TaxID=1970455 RepID=UPI002A807E3A|nr:electron transport complex subunit RsxG [Reinekea sp.]